MEGWASEFGIPKKQLKGPQKVLVWSCPSGGGVTRYTSVCGQQDGVSVARQGWQ